MPISEMKERAPLQTLHTKRKICKYDELHYKNIFVKFNEMDTFLKEYSLLKLIRRHTYVY